MLKHTAYPEATSSLILYTAKQYGGLNSLNVKHGDAGNIALAANNWLYLSAAQSGMQTYLWSEVNPADNSLSYLNHIESLITASRTPDLTVLYPQAQYPLQYLGIDPSVVTMVRLEIDASQPTPNTVASTTLVGGSETSVTTLSLPGLPGVLGFVSTISGSSTIASCPYGDYDTADGTVAWSGTGSMVLEYVNGGVTIVSTTGFPEGWAFEAPVKQGDGTWKVTLNGEASSPSITSLNADPTSIVADGETASTLTAVVTDSVSGAALSGITVKWSASEGGNLSVSQSVTDGNGKATTSLTSTSEETITVWATLDNESSASTQVTVRGVKTVLQVMGSRSSIHASCQSQVGTIVVFDGETHDSISAYWYYQGETAKQYSHSFIDTKPYLPLYVQSENDVSNYVVLNPSNVTGNGNWDNDGPGKGSFCALLNNATVIGWGNPSYGGSTPPTTYNQNVYALSATFEAFASIRSQNQVYGWGASGEGGTVPQDVLSRTDIVEVKSTQGTFACRGTKVAPYIKVWGWATDGTAPFDLNVPTNISNMANIVSLHGGDNAFAVVSSSGTVHAWGDTTAGGTVSNEVSLLNNISSCCSSRRAFAVIYGEGQLMAWGDTDFGADASTVVGITTAQRLVATESAFTALLNTGGIACWGYPLNGGNLPSEYRNRLDIIDIKSTYGAFAALCSDGTVFCWGNTSFGGDCSSVAKNLVNVVSISANGSSFAALTLSGTVVTWGNADWGGSTAGATGSLDGVRAIYGNTHAFVALKADKSVVAWGDPNSGVSNFPSTLNNNMSYLK